jgi:3-hydroxyisobutyrate dehydrogenase-like beta-hydroxyacid dehydrogenase
MREIQKVGFVGLGHAGWPMAENVAAAGYTLAVTDADAERERAFAAEHDGVDAGLGAFGGCDLVVTMLPNGDVVRAVLLGEGGLAAHLAPGTIVVDTSSSDPYGTRALGDELARRSLTLLDAPVTRPDHDKVNTRRIAFMVGGDDPEAIDRALPVLEAMAERVFRAGPLGHGHAMKALNNFVACAGEVAALDAMMIGARFGLDVETMLHVFNAGTGRNFVTEHVLLDEGLSRRYDTGFQLALMAKDMGIATTLAEGTGFDTTWPAQLRARMAAALAALGDPAADHSEALKYWERLAEVELPPLRAPVV